MHCGDQAVILMIEHGEAGSMGLILNRRTNYTLGTMNGADKLPSVFSGEFWIHL